MKLYLAGYHSNIGDKLFVEEKVDRELATFAYLADLRHREVRWATIRSPRDVMIDSGAFSVWNKGHQVDPGEYCDWALAFRERWAGQLDSLRFITLDVIGDQDATWTNHEYLVSRGLDPIPVLTMGAKRHHVQRAISECPYFCLGGLVQSPRLGLWLDHIFKTVVRHREETGQMRRVHLLGVSTPRMLKRYPAYSSDSSSWLQVLQFGKGFTKDRKLPSYTKGPGERAAQITRTRELISEMRRLETEVTNLWTSRGITFDEEDHAA